MTRTDAARPVLKWAGGKTKLVESICALLPKKIETYFEPFAGGAAVFFALAKEGRFRKAVLSDSNPELVNVYQALQSDVDGVISALRRKRYDEESYYRVREQNPSKSIQQAARTIYLNKTGFNGLYRVNRSGLFNVPFGRYTNPTICDEPNLRLVAECLRGVELKVDDFKNVCKFAKMGDAVYLDPPYLPVSATAYFTSYDRHPFLLKEHKQLAKVFSDLAKKKVVAVLSNSDTPETRELYQEWSIAFLQVPRSINSRTSNRGPVSELLVVNRQVRTSRASRQRAPMQEG
jgi:DNA adenine methylase